MKAKLWSIEHNSWVCGFDAYTPKYQDASVFDLDRAAKCCAEAAKKYLSTLDTYGYAPPLLIFVIPTSDKTNEL